MIYTNIVTLSLPNMNTRYHRHGGFPLSRSMFMPKSPWTFQWYVVLDGMGFMYIPRQM
jgi:hypothetical protein